MDQQMAGSGAAAGTGTGASQGTIGSYLVGANRPLLLLTDGVEPVGERMDGQERGHRFRRHQDGVNLGPVSTGGAGESPDSTGCVLGLWFHPGLPEPATVTPAYDDGR